jgi:hypothetical protein
MRVPGGPKVAIAMAVLGWLTTAASIVLATVPPGDEPDKTLAVVKVVGASVVLVAVGIVIYAVGRRKGSGL